MKTDSHNILWFTLIELIVSMTIFSIIMVSVISIYIFSSQLSSKIEVNRVLQENIKNVVETIADDVKKNGIIWVSPSSLQSCSLSAGASVIGTKLCVGQNEYYFAKDIWWEWIRQDDPKEACKNLQDECRIVKKDILTGKIFPLSNNYVTFRDFSFEVYDGDVPFVNLRFVLQPAVWNGVPPSLIKGSSMVFQTTISERIIDIN